MKAIKFTNEQIETIKNALQYVSDKKMDVIRNNRTILSEEAKKSILESANKYFNLIDLFD
jgi:succinate dehydrogenase/fumarate reductase flavoprotein subunit